MQIQRNLNNSYPMAHDMNHTITIPAFRLCVQQRCKSHHADCTKSGQCLCFLSVRKYEASVELISRNKSRIFCCTCLFSSPEPLGSQGELIGYPSSRRPSIVRPSVVVVNNFKHLLLRNRWADQSQILCGASLGRGNDILFAASGSHDQDGRHAHIW